MKISIKTTVHMPEVPESIEIPSGSLRDLLLGLFASTPVAKEIVDPRTGEILLEGLFEVSLNGMPHNKLPDGLDTPLHDGDRLTISLVLIGGG